MYKKELEKKQKEFGGLQKMSKNAKEWFDDSIKSSKDKSVSKHKGVFQMGKMYTFEYNPLTKDKLWYYDKNPTIIVIGVKSSSKLFYGINLNYYPLKNKKEIISVIRDKLNSQYSRAIKNNSKNSKQQKAIKYPQTLFKDIAKLGANFGIRSYYLNRVKNAYCICYEDWVNAFFLDNMKLYGINEKHKDTLFREFLKKS